MLMSPILEGSGHTQYLENTVKTVLHNAGIAPVQLDGKDISTYFGVRAAAKQKAMGTGRHPASLPKNSELWHYSKLSTQRRDRIKKGHQFWDVVEEENVTSTIPQAETEEKEVEDEYTIRARELQFVKGSSINEKLRKFLSSTKNNDMQHLELRIDFKNKNQIYFGMSFIIMNYNDEILYVNSREELRCKPISQIESSDRIKFKMVDLNNPSNPQPLSFGDTMYLQCLDSSETADNSFSVGTVLTSKLFGLPQHSSLNFDVNQHFTTTDNYGTATSSIPADIGVYADETADAAPDLISDKLPPAPPSLTRRGSTINIVRTAPTTPHSSQTHPHTPHSHLKPLETEDYENVSAFDFPSPGKNSADATARDTKTADSTTTAVTPTNTTSHTSRHFTNAATICGDCHITRICEMRQLENSLGVSADYGLLSDDKAMRYTSKAAALLGKWCVHSAELPNSPTKPKTQQGGRKDSAKKEGMHSMHATKSDNHTSGAGPLKDHRVYSMTPIFIQQDLYCISTKQPSEHTTWPMRSTAIINHSQNISRETAVEYRQAYRESAVVKNALQARQHTKGTTRLYDPDDLLEAEQAQQNTTPNKNANDNASANGLNSPMSQNGNSNTPTNGNNNKPEPAYGCLRKVVRRGPPYDFSVDRRCVWKFCLFEQFSDNNIKLSVKDRAAKKVMETATMAMKLSQLNREGAHTHIHSHTYGHELPPLKSGESFVRTLREINFKTTMKLEEKYLQMRREKEARLSEHFATHMTQFRQMERQDTRTTNSSQAHSRSNSTVHTASPLHSPNPSNYANSFGVGASTKFNSDGSLADSSLDTYSNYSTSGTSKMPNLMAKTAARRTSFLIDTLPTSVKNKKSESSFSSPTHGGGSVSSAYSGSVLSGNHSQNTNMFSPSTASARISAYGNPAPAVKFSGDTAENSPIHSPTRPHGNNYGNANLGNGSHSSKHHASHYQAPISALNNNNTLSTSASHIHNGIVKDVVSSTFLTAANPTALTVNTALPYSSSISSGAGTNRTKQNVTFSTPTPTSQLSSPTPVRVQPKNTISNTPAAYPSYPDTPGHNRLLPQTQFQEIQHAMKLVTQAVAGLPDMDHQALKREEEIHLNPRRLLLDNPNSLHLFDDLSAGEKVLALHKTFHHIGEMDPNRPRRHSNVKKASTTGVAAKLAKLMEEDANIQKVIHHKERRDRIKNKEELYEQSSGI